MRTAALALFVLAACLPHTAHAANFPAAPIWLSSDAITDGDAVTVYAVVCNPSDAVATGTVRFLADDALFDSKSFSLKGNASSLVSAVWTARAGTHTFKAETTDADGTQKETPDITATVAEAPAPTGVTAAAQAAATLAGNALAAATAVTEELRSYGIQALSGSAAAGAGAPAGEVLGASIEGTSSPRAPAAGARGANSPLTAWLLYICEHPYLFYPFLILTLFLVLYLVSRVFTRAH